MVCSRNREQPLFREQKVARRVSPGKGFGRQAQPRFSLASLGLASVPLNRHVTNPTWFSALSFMEKGVPNYTCTSRATYDQPSFKPRQDDGPRHKKRRGGRRSRRPFRFAASRRRLSPGGSAGSTFSGNCWLDVPGLVRIERTGLPPARRPPRNTANLSTAAAAESDAGASGAGARRAHLDATRPSNADVLEAPQRGASQLGARQQSAPLPA